MQQYFAKNKNLELEKTDYHHIKNVMRMKKGDLIKIAFDKNVFLCELEDVTNDISFKILKKEVKYDNLKKIDVAFSLIKEQKLDYLLQKSTEVGADKLIPITTLRSVVKLDLKKFESKKIRWGKILKEASEQSFRSNVPILCNLQNLKDIVNLDYDLKLLCSLNKNTKLLKNVLQKHNKCDRILLVVGPEGGFSDEEEEYLINNGFICISLGENVLRAETAPVSAISMINYEFMR